MLGVQTRNSTIKQVLTVVHVDSEETAILTLRLQLDVEVAVGRRGCLWCTTCGLVAVRFLPCVARDFSPFYTGRRVVKVCPALVEKVEGTAPSFPRKAPGLVAHIRIAHRRGNVPCRITCPLFHSDLQQYRDSIRPGVIRVL